MKLLMLSHVSFSKKLDTTQRWQYRGVEHVHYYSVLVSMGQKEENVVEVVDFFFDYIKEVLQQNRTFIPLRPIITYLVR